MLINKKIVYYANKPICANLLMNYIEVFRVAWGDTIGSKIQFRYIPIPLAIAGFTTPLFKDFLDIPYWQAVVCAILFVLLLLFFFFIFGLIDVWLRAHKLEKKNIYGDVLLVLKDFFAKIHQLRKLNRIEPVLLKPALQEVCNNLKQCFDKKTKSKCCVSIKLFEKIMGDGNIDSNATVYKRDSDIYRRTEHTVFLNTPFLEIAQKPFTLDGNPNYYLNNDIPNTKPYKNTSKSSYRKGILPYKSELVVPLLPLRNDDGTQPSLLGFICIDSNKKKSFGTKYDLPTVQGVADGVYDVIMKWKFSSDAN